MGDLLRNFEGVELVVGGSNYRAVFAVDGGCGTRGGGGESTGNAC